MITTQRNLMKNPLVLGLLAVLLLAALAFGWWTLSPFFIRTSVNEGQNISVPAGQASNAESSDKSSQGMTESKAAVQQPTPTQPPMAAKESGESMADANPAPDSTSGSPTQAPEEATSPAVLGVGNFDRKDDIHYANGQAILARQSDGSVLVRLQDLDAANGPDLYVYVSEHPNPQNSDQLHLGGHNLGTLKATNGSFNYTLDASIDPTKVKSVVIYCRAFSVIFSTASLQSP